MPGVLRNGLWLGFFAAILGSWAWLYAMASDMGLGLTGRPALQALWDDLCLAAGSPMTRLDTLFGMWGAMTAAMMLPTLVPTLRTYGRLIHSANGTEAGRLGLILGYALVWLVLAGGFAVAQVALVRMGAVDALGIATRPWIAGLLLLGAGVYQFTRFKEACRDACMSPLAFFMGRWRPGFDGGVRMGVSLGLFCAGCCWALMALAFVGGTMSLAWMGLATALMVLEKLPDLGRYITKPLGLVLIAAAAAVPAWSIATGG